MNIWSKEMRNASLNFSSAGYVLLNRVLTKADCAKYAQRIKKADLTLDEQCPKSPAVHGLFDDLLLKLKPTMEGLVDASLYPTYSYARIYTPGEILKRHTDRESCEISCTITLAYKGDGIWPIYFKRRNKSVSKVEIPVGSMAAYKGIEREHWRNKYVEGTEQIQVFLHYVLAEGEHSHFIFDRRGGLNV